MITDVASVPVPTPDDPGGLTIGQYYEQVVWPKTRKYWRRKATRYAAQAFARFDEGLRVRDITTRKLDQFRQWLRDKGYAPETIRSHVTMCRAVLRDFDPEQFPDLSPVPPFDDKDLPGSLRAYVDQYGLVLQR